MAAKLKVYAARIDGLHDWIVAAPNQAAALEAWGVNQNLFQQGVASVTDAPDAVKAALARPGVALRRLNGTQDAFAPAPAEGDLKGWSAAAKAAGVAASKMKRAALARPTRDTAKLDAAKRALSDFEADARADLDELAARREALEEETSQTERELETRRTKLRAAVDKARS